MQTQPHGNFQIFDLKITDERHVYINPVAGLFNDQHHAVRRTRGDHDFERRLRTADRIDLTSFRVYGGANSGATGPRICTTATPFGFRISVNKRALALK